MVLYLKCLQTTISRLASLMTRWKRNKRAMTMAVMSWIRGDEAVTKEWGPLGYVQLENGERWLVEVEEDSVGPNKARDGSDIPVKVIRTLLLANGEVVYGCADCFYVARRIESAVPHRNAHSTKNRGPRKKKARNWADIDAENSAIKIADAVTNNAMTVEDFEPLTDAEVSGEPTSSMQDDESEFTNAVWAIEQLLGRARAADQMAEERDIWMNRALDAERRMQNKADSMAAFREAMAKVMES